MKKFFMIFTIIVCIIIILVLTPIKSQQIFIDRIDPEQITLSSIAEQYIPLSVYGKGFKEEDEIYLNGKRVETAFGHKGWITCYIDKENYNNLGIIDVEVKRINKNKKVSTKSNLIKLCIEE